MKTLYVCIGIPGCGKSSWTDKFISERTFTSVINMDAIRLEKTGSYSDQSKNGIVHAVATERLKKSMEDGTDDIIWDNTTVVMKYRKPLIQMANDYGYNVVAVFFNVALDVAKARNVNRSRIVPEDVINRMFASLVPPLLSEGFTEIIKVEN